MTCFCRFVSLVETRTEQSVFGEKGKNWFFGVEKRKEKAMRFWTLAKRKP